MTRSGICSSLVAVLGAFTGADVLGAGAGAGPVDAMKPKECHIN